MKRLKFSLVVLLILSNLFFPSQSVLSNQISQTRIPDEYEAINAYKKALDVDPNFEHAKEMLKKPME